MLTVKLKPEVTAEDLCTNVPYFIAYIRDQDLKVGWVTGTKVGVIDSEGGKWTLPTDFLQDWPEEGVSKEQFKTIGAELTNGGR